MRVTIVLLLLALAAHTHAKVYERCELAREFKCKYKIPPSQLDDWVCLVQAETNYDTAAGSDSSPIIYYGLFKIYDYNFCKSSAHPTNNICEIDCSKLIDSDIADDVACALKIYDSQGFYPWYGWRARCENRDLSSYTSDCNLNCKPSGS